MREQWPISALARHWIHSQTNTHRCSPVCMCVCVCWPFLRKRLLHSAAAFQPSRPLSVHPADWQDLWYPALWQVGQPLDTDCYTRPSEWGTRSPAVQPGLFFFLSETSWFNCLITICIISNKSAHMRACAHTHRGTHSRQNSSNIVDVKKRYIYENFIPLYSREKERDSVWERER